MVDENVSGEQASGDAPEVKNEQVNETAQNVENVENLDVENLVPVEAAVEQAEQQPEPEVEAAHPPVAKPLDPDEQILNDMFESGKTEVTTSELITAGFDTARMSQYAFEVGQFKLSRLLLVMAYKIEKK